MKKLDITLNIILIILLLIGIVILVMATIACKKAENMCEHEWENYAENSSAFLPYTDAFGNPTSTKPLDICREGK